MIFNHSHVFIDGANVWRSSNALGFTIDFKALGAWLTETFDQTRINYYTAVVTDEDQKQELRPLIDWLSYNGYHVVEKAAKYKGEDAHGRKQYKGNMDIEIAVDCARLIHNTQIRRVVLFSGDGDFVPVVRYMQEYGTHVTVISTRETQPSFLAEELRKTADSYIDLAAIREFIQQERN